jgi:hypothetical protein
MDVPMVGTYVMQWVAAVVGPRYVGLAALAPAFAPLAETGKAAKLAAKLLAAVVVAHDEARARAVWEESGLSLQAWLHPEDRDTAHEVAFAEENKMGWLFPFLGCQKYLDTALAGGEEPAAVIEWLKANLSEELINSGKCARVLMRALLTHFSSAEKAASLKKYGFVAENFYGEDTAGKKALQLEMVYEVQLFCNESNFEAGLVKRLFHAIYEYDMVIFSISIFSVCSLFNHLKIV